MPSVTRDIWYVVVVASCIFNLSYQLGGPIWARPIFDPATTTRLLDHMRNHTDLYKAHKRITGMVTALSEELPDIPLFLSLSHICSVAHLTTPPVALYRCVGSSVLYY